jgi:hypothetical protein
MLEERCGSLILVILLLLLFDPHLGNISTSFAAKMGRADGIGLPGITLVAGVAIGHVAWLVGSWRCKLPHSILCGGA